MKYTLCSLILYNIFTIISVQKHVSKWLCNVILNPRCWRDYVRTSLFSFSFFLLLLPLCVKMCASENAIFNMNWLWMLDAVCALFILKICKRRKRERVRARNVMRKTKWADTLLAYGNFDNVKHFAHHAPPKSSFQMRWLAFVAATSAAVKLLQI